MIPAAALLGVLFGNIIFQIFINFVQIGLLLCVVENRGRLHVYHMDHCKMFITFYSIIANTEFTNEWLVDCNTDMDSASALFYSSSTAGDSPKQSTVRRTSRYHV